MYDIIIIGGGPAGLTAALYARRAEKKVLLIEKETFGGQITFSPKVENIPGFIELSGNEFADKLVEQVLNQGADIECCEVLEVNKEDGYFNVITDDENYEGKAVIIATGAKHRTLELENEEKYIGNGISFCAVCDGAFYKDKTVAVVGGGNSALQEAILLSDLVNKLYIIQNLEYMTGEQKLQDQLNANDNVEIICGAVVSKYLGDDELSAVIIEKNDSTSQEIKLDGLFLAVGLLPQNEAFANIIKLNEWGYAQAGEDCKTDSEGIFVAGDCRTKKIRQVATAVSDGAIAALAACDYLDSIK